MKANRSFDNRNFPIWKQKEQGYSKIFKIENDVTAVYFKKFLSEDKVNLLILDL